MKPASFDYTRPNSLAEAVGLLDSDAVKCLAGGQSLGPMLNLRLVRPRLLVDITRIAELGQVEILDYVVVEDGGVLVNPMIVDGQIQGGTAQGIGTALYEEMRFDADGQPLASTLADYLIPGACEVPAVRIRHIETASPYTEFGVKGIGEGGAIAPPAAIGNAVNDALRPLGAEVTELPITPRRVLAAIAAAAAP